MGARSRHLAGAVLLAAVMGVAWTTGEGLGGLAYLAYYVLVTLPGWPVGWALFGRRHPAGWVFGALLGYALTTLAFWVPLVLGQPSRFGFALAWLVLAVASAVAASRLRSPLVNLPAWGRRESVALALVLLLVPALVGWPFANIGREDARGTRYYRAYFTADFLWHTAMTAELTKFEWPPRNPYLANETIHYYWTYMLVPAVASAEGPSPVRDVQRALKINALCSGVLFFAAIFLAAWIAVPRTVAVTAAVVLTALASSAEGAYAIWDLRSRGLDLSVLRHLNIDAISTWNLHGLRVDGLQRALWYTPQHSMAGALGLAALSVAVAGGASAATGAIVLAGIALGASTMFNPFVGVLFSLGYGLAITLGIAARRDRPARLFRHAAAALPVALAVGWAVMNRMLDGAGGALQVGFTQEVRTAPIRGLLVSVGPVLLPATLGLWPRSSLPFLRVLPAAVTAMLGLLFAHTLFLSLDLSWVGFRATQAFLVVAPALVARFLAGDGRSHAVSRLVAAMAFVLALVGLPTTVIDTFNAQDVTNRAMGPGFRWTLALTPAQQHALAWIRRYTPPDAVVSMEPVARGRDNWSLIPSFAERRMPAGLPISLLNTPVYAERSEQVREVYATTDTPAAWRLAHALGIDYVYLDGRDRSAYSRSAIDKFALHPQYFRPVFYDDDVAVFEVLSDADARASSR